MKVPTYETTLEISVFFYVKFEFLLFPLLVILIHFIEDLQGISFLLENFLAPIGRGFDRRVEDGDFENFLRIVEIFVPITIALEVFETVYLLLVLDRVTQLKERDIGLRDQHLVILVDVLRSGQSEGENRISHLLRDNQTVKLVSSAN